MKLAFALFHYFPYGGLERDMLAIATLCQQRGHEVCIYTISWEGEKPANIPVIELPGKGFGNHTQALNFSRQLSEIVKHASFDAVIGFNKMPGLDVYYAADVCFAQKAWEERSWWYRLSGRSKTYLKLEESVFGRDQSTRIMMISSDQIDIFQRYYQTPGSRFHLLPPGIRRERVMPADYSVVRAQLRRQYGLKEDAILLLMVGSDFKRKGVDRAIASLEYLPEHLRECVQLLVAGQDNPRPFLRQAEKLGVGHCVNFPGARDDISALMWAADVLLHPAYSENTGTVLLEGMVAGLPVIATDVCGYAHYIRDHQMGVVLTGGGEPLVRNLAQAIRDVTAVDAEQWRNSGRILADTRDIFSLMERAVEFVEAGGIARS